MKWKDLATLIVEQYQRGGGAVFVHSGLQLMAAMYPRAKLQVESTRELDQPLSKKGVCRILWEWFQGTDSPEKVERPIVVWTAKDHEGRPGHIGLARVGMTGDIPLEVA